ncbi:dipicolinate synthase subunit A, partial [Bacillus sp. SIMBA_154]
MSSGLTVAGIGGDARQVVIIRKLSEQRAKGCLVGLGQLDHGCIE